MKLIQKTRKTKEVLLPAKEGGYTFEEAAAELEKAAEAAEKKGKELI